MKLENQVVSLGLAKKLKELGVKQESLFWWWELYQGPDQGFDPKYFLGFGKTVGVEVYISAFTVAELGEMLPDYIAGEHLYSYQQARSWADPKKPRHRLCYWFMGDIELYSVDCNNEADARAKMLIYLIENGLIK